MVHLQLSHTLNNDAVHSLRCKRNFGSGIPTMCGLSDYKGYSLAG